MTLTINDTMMTSDQTTHTAWQEPSGHTWEVLWLPEQLLDRNSAELGLTRYDAVARASQPAATSAASRSNTADGPIRMRLSDQPARSASQRR